VDEEGGTVTRISRYPQFRSEPFKSPQDVYAGGGWDAVAADTSEKDALLKSLGLNLNFAPVCDVPDDPTDFIYSRSLGPMPR
jgi:beta-N-acetylhexosaminidase